MSNRQRGLALAWAVCLFGVRCGGDGPSAPGEVVAQDAGSLPSPLDAGTPHDASDAGHAVLPEAATPDADDDAGPTPARDAGMDATTEPAPPPTPAAPLANFDPPARAFGGTLTLTLTAAVAGDELHYTLDGSVPTARSPRYAGPIAIAETTLVRAVAVRGGLAGAIVNQGYVQLAGDAAGFESNLPILVISMLGDDPPDPSLYEYVPALFMLFEPDGGRTRLNGPAAHSSRLGVKVRGRSTRTQPKHSYTLELWGDNSEDAPQSLLGMPPDGDWVLYAPYTYDRTLMRNAFVYELSNRIGRYAAHTRFCEVFFLSNSDVLAQASYAGVYVLMERLTRSPNRIAIKKLGPSQNLEPAITGGYILQVDDPNADNQAFEAAGQTFLYVDPDPDVITPQQQTYIADYLNGWQRASLAGDGIDPMTGKAYGELIDKGAFIDQHILNMLAKNPDAFSLSAYYHKDRSGPLAAGPVWDFDIAMGGDDPWGDRSLDPTHWGPSTSDSNFRRLHYDALFDHAEFTAEYWARWDTLLASTFTPDALHGVIDGFKAQLAPAELRNRARWPEMAPRNASYDDEVNALRAWLDARLLWIQQNKGMTPP